MQLCISSSSRVKAMPPPGKVPRKENLGLQCEWGSCSFVCSAMEEFCEHVTQHLQKYLHSSEEEEEEEDLLGKGAGYGKGSRESGKSDFPFCRGRRQSGIMVIYFPNCFFCLLKHCKLLTEDSSTRIFKMSLLSSHQKAIRTVL